MLVYQRVFCGWGRWARVRFPRERGLLERQHSWLLSDASDQRLLESCPNISYMCAKASTMQHLGLKRTILKNFEHVCRDWLLDPYIQIIPNLKAYTKMPGWSAFLPLCLRRCSFHTCPTGAIAVDLGAPFRGGSNSRMPHRTFRTFRTEGWKGPTEASFWVRCAQNRLVGRWIPWVVSFFYLYCLFVANATRQQTHANQDKPRLWTITEQTQGASRMVAQHKPCVLPLRNRWDWSPWQVANGFQRVARLACSRWEVQWWP